MKPSSRDYLAITAALLSILLCGYGIGFLIGERTTRQRLAPPPAQVQTAPDWTETTVARLARELSLTPDQRAAVTKEVGLTATAIGTTRHEAIRRYRLALIELHQRLLPHLDAGQRRQVEESQRLLQQSLAEDRDPATAPSN